MTLALKISLPPDDFHPTNVLNGKVFRDCFHDKRNKRTVIIPQYERLVRPWSGASTVVEYRDLVSVSGLISRHIYTSLSLEGFRSRLGLGGYRSQSQTCCLETFNMPTATIWLNKTSAIQRVSLSAAFAGKKQHKQVRKMPEIRKNFNLKVVQVIFWKFLQKFQQNPQIFRSRVSLSDSLMNSRSGSRSRSFNQVTVSTTSL